MNKTHWSLLLALSVLAAAVSLGVVSAQSERSENIEVRVWESTSDAEKNYISARPEGGSWRTLGTISLPLDEETDNGRYRYGDITITVPLPPAEPDLGPVSPRAGMVEIACTYYRSEWGDNDPRNASWQIEGTFLHRLPRNYGSVPIHVGVQPKRPDDVPSNFDGQSWDEKAVIVGEIVERGVRKRWNVSVGSGPYPGNYYVDFPKLYVVSYYTGDPIHRRVALDPAVECVRAEDVSQ
ncbi:MAG: hypothetical protein OXH41_00650 [Chloroflexi bacterium]|nr:hypothetical protein [Chloroflexota bacterium]